jgi:hypothetical protein
MDQLKSSTKYSVGSLKIDWMLRNRNGSVRGTYWWCNTDIPYWWCNTDDTILPYWWYHADDTILMIPYWWYRTDDIILMIPYWWYHTDDIILMIPYGWYHTDDSIDLLHILILYLHAVIPDAVLRENNAYHAKEAKEKRELLAYRAMRSAERQKKRS